MSFESQRIWSGGCVERYLPLKSAYPQFCKKQTGRHFGFRQLGPFGWPATSTSPINNIVRSTYLKYNMACIDCYHICIICIAYVSHCEQTSVPYDIWSTAMTLLWNCYIWHCEFTSLHACSYHTAVGTAIYGTANTRQWHCRLFEGLYVTADASAGITGQ